MMIIDACPKRSILFSLILGGLEDGLASAALQHVQTCENCTAQLDEIERFDPLLKALKTTGADPDPGEATLAAEAADRISQRIVQELQSELSKPHFKFKQGDLISQRYLIERPLGRGGMGEVYLAKDKDLSRLVAIKFTNNSHHVNLQRFKKEAEALASLEHENICPIFHTDVHESQPLLVLKYIEGETLSAILRKGPVKMPKALAYAIAISKALAAAHQQGIVHRDLKPGNVMIQPDGRICLMDFGLSKDTMASDLTSTGQVVGTPKYMAPEQLDTKLGPVGPYTDIFAFGLLLREMIGEQPNKPSRSEKQLSAICDRATSRRPNDRYQSAHELVSALNAVSLEPFHSKTPLPRILTSSTLVLSGIAIAACAVWLGALASIDEDGKTYSNPKSITAPPIQKEFISDQELLRIIETDVRSLADADRPFVRYLSLRNVWNGSNSESDLQSVSDAAKQLIQRLCNRESNASPNRVGRNGVLLRIDLREHDWNPMAHWYEMLKQYPYGLDISSETYSYLQRELDTEIPYIRADWFIYHASRLPLASKLMATTDANIDERQRDLQAAPVQQAATRYAAAIDFASLGIELGIPVNSETAKAAGLKCSTESLVTFSSGNRTLKTIGFDKLNQSDLISRDRFEAIFRRVAREIGIGIPRTVY